MLNSGASPSVSINGVRLDLAELGGIEEVTVDDDLGLPAMFSITLRHFGGSVEKAGARIGAKVEINGPGGVIRKPLVVGEITTVIGDFGPQGRRIHIRGYDVSHRLHRGRQTRTYLKVTDSEICQRIAEKAKIDIGTVDRTETRYEHVSQANQSDWEFLKARAKAINYDVRVDDGKLNFRKRPDPSSGVWAKVAFGQGGDMGTELFEYHPRLTASEQVARVEVRGWDRENKQEVVGRAEAGTVAAKTDKNSPSSLAQTFGSATFVQANQAVANRDEADQAATVLAERIGSSFAEADGVARGNGDLRAGTTVSISGIADEFDGDFVLSHTRHIFDRTGYRTHFSISGRQERSLLGLVSFAGVSAAASNGKAGSDRLYGVVLAVVTANDDPGKQGRVKLKFPWLAADYESTWAPVVQLGAGPDSGAVFIPEVHDEVLVAFEAGDVNRPYVVGGLYNGVDKPRLGEGLFDNGKVKRRGFVSRKGHRMVFFDDDGESGIALLSSDDKFKVALKQSGNELHIYGDPKVVIEAKSSIEVTSQGDLKLRATGNLEIQADGQMKIKSGSVLDIDGSIIQLN